ncbi:hypothetical protein [Bradyrhizobium diazoefficiens]|uniref:hypothetical protein n=1 Tax=Bradyrhizobium diazoefficiens TaxID=1355477 RepID=UPI0036F217F8
MRSQVRLPDPIAAVFITEQLADRQTAAPDFLREKLAIQNLAEMMSDHPDEVLPRLVKLGMEICGAHSAGISIFEPEVGQFRWHALAGELATFEGATTPRNFSPCGVCLDLAQPILMEHPERAYDWIRDAGITVPRGAARPIDHEGGGGDRDALAGGRRHRPLQPGACAGDGRTVGVHGHGPAHGPDRAAA